jgi:hypothetical protein
MELGIRPRRDKRPRPCASLRPGQQVPRHAKAGSKHDGCTCSKRDAVARSHHGMTVTSSCLTPVWGGASRLRGRARQEAAAARRGGHPSAVRVGSVLSGLGHRLGRAISEQEYRRALQCSSCSSAPCLDLSSRASLRCEHLFEASRAWPSRDRGGCRRDRRHDVASREGIQ